MKVKFAISFILILLIIILFFILPVKTAIVFYEENTDKIAAFLPINEGETFEIIFTHSIHLTDVVEKYQVTEELNIKQYEIIFEHFGIGMPSNAEGEEVFEYKDGKYHISNLNNIFESINIRNGKTVSEHRLLWSAGEEEEQNMVWFNDYFEPGAWFRVQVKRVTTWELLKGVEIDVG
ncbi:DUF1850 domain-containing protein [Oceanobacillus sp. CAU 1775]